MGWFDSLKGLIGAENVKLLDFSRTEDKSTSVSPTVNAPRNNYFVSLFAVNNLTQNSEKIEEPLKQAIEASRLDGSGFLATTQEGERDLKLLEAYSSSDSDAEERNFVFQHLPKKDHYIWLAAFVLRREAQSHNTQEVQRLKNNLRESHGDRGSNIANLCNSNYLASHIIPLFRYFVTEKGDEQQFLQSYENIVTEYPFAVFVSTYDTPQKVETDVLEKARAGIYGLEQMHVHGIGQTNVQKIHEVALKLAKEHPDILSIESIESSRSTIKLTFSIHKSEPK